MSFHFTCPQCGQRMTMNFETSQVYCPHCGYVRRDEISALGQPQRPPRPARPTPLPVITYQGELSLRARAAFDTGADLVTRGDAAGALRAFVKAAEIQHDFADAHLWIARLSADPAQRMQHLDTALALDPNNGEAVRLKMVLTGRLTPEQAARSYNEAEPVIAQAQGPVEARADVLICPRCNGNLVVNLDKRRVECRFCGYSAPHVGPDNAGADLLTMAMLERRAQPVRWNVGQRLIVCRQCGAEHTVPPGKLSAHCRFCGSTQVLLGDVLQSFEQPDGIAPFALSPEGAAAAIQKALKNPAQRLANLFNTNRVQSVQVEGVYIPYWVFDVNVEVTTTQTQVLNGILMSDTTKGMDLMPEVAIPGVKSPTPGLLMRLAPYRLGDVEPYQPKWLASQPAALYSIDFDRASLDARELAAKAMRRKHERVVENTRTDERGRQTTDVTRATVRVQNMIFQLLLLPVWIATLTEVDADVRLALVNGQTGKVAFGKAERRGGE
ncbi:MAG: hypothetical protein IT323_00030 [Anaerolineae bacterium]|nr:hypothetical protein [Anaerolineae bacterium]